MLHFKSAKKGSVLVVEIMGSIDESVDFKNVITFPVSEVEINCKGVSRINSTGIAGWIKFFQGTKNQGYKLRLTECSPVIVETINMISNFICHGVVESIYLPFMCRACDSTYLDLRSVAELRKHYPNPPASSCPKCKSATQFDDNPPEYLGFLDRT